MVGTMALTDEISGRMTASHLFPFNWDGWTSTLDRPHGATYREVSVPWIDLINPVEKGRSSSQSTEIFSSRWESPFTPRTDLGRCLYALRTKALVAGMKLFSEEEVLDEVKRRRGEVEGK